MPKIALVQEINETPVQQLITRIDAHGNITNIKKLVSIKAQVVDIITNENGILKFIDTVALVKKENHIPIIDDNFLIINILVPDLLDIPSPDDLALNSIPPFRLLEKNSKNPNKYEYKRIESYNDLKITYIVNIEIYDSCASVLISKEVLDLETKVVIDFKSASYDLDIH